MSTYFVIVDDVTLRIEAEVSFDGFGVDVYEVYARDSEMDIGPLLNDHMFKTIENEILKEQQEMAKHLREED